MNTSSRWCLPVILQVRSTEWSTPSYRAPNVLGGGLWLDRRVWTKAGDESGFALYLCLVILLGEVKTVLPVSTDSTDTRIFLLGVVFKISTSTSEEDLGRVEIRPPSVVRSDGFDGIGAL